MSLTTRRTWMTSLAGAGLLAAGSRKIRAAAAEPAVGIVDAHVHIWTSDTEKYPLAAGFTEKDLWFPSYSAEETARLGAAAGVTRFNLIQMTWYGLDHSYILDVIAADPKRFVGTGIVPAVADVSIPSPDATMVALAAGGVVAFRVRGKSTRPKIGGGERWMDYAGFDKMFTAGAEHNLALSFLMSPADLPELDRMCAKHGDTPVIVDHFCLIGRNMMFLDSEIEALAKLARHKRVMVKLGAFYGLGNKTPPYLDMLPLIRRVVDAFGPERCMWESDAPLQTKDSNPSQAAVAVIGEHADFLSPGDKHQILVKTAENFFFKR